MTLHEALQRLDKGSMIVRESEGENALRSFRMIHGLPFVCYKGEPAEGQRLFSDAELAGEWKIIDA
jgi:hypothetical protein